MEPDDQIAEFVGQIVAEKREMLGSQIGFAVKKRFPDFAFRPTYAGMADFISKKCADTVLFKGTRGNDLFFTSAVEPSSTAMTANSADASVWRLFANPSLPGEIVVGVDSGELTTVTEEVAETAATKKVRRITNEDSRQICAAFLDELKDPVAAELKTILDRPNFWREWVQAVKSLDGGRFQLRWLQFRRSALERELQKRLEELGLSVEQQNVAVGRVLRSKTPARRSESTKFRMESSGKVDSRLRRLAHAAIDLMSDEELRRLNIPFGVAYEAGARPRS